MYQTYKLSNSCILSSKQCVDLFMNFMQSKVATTKCPLKKYQFFKCSTK